MNTGFTTDGEFNSLWWRGNDRPFTVLQARSDMHAKYQHEGLKRWLEIVRSLSNNQHESVCDNRSRESHVHTLGCNYSTNSNNILQRETETEKYIQCRVCM